MFEKLVALFPLKKTPTNCNIPAFCHCGNGKSKEYIIISAEYGVFRPVLLMFNPSNKMSIEEARKASEWVDGQIFSITMDELFFDGWADTPEGVKKIHKREKEEKLRKLSEKIKKQNDELNALKKELKKIR